MLLSKFQQTFTSRIPCFTHRAFRIGKSPRIGEVFQVPIESLDKQGSGVVTIEWDTMQKQLAPTRLVVRGALPGETVRFRVISVHSTGTAVQTVLVNLFGRRESVIRPRIDSEPWRSSLEPELLPPGHTESPDFEPFGCPHFDRRHDELSCRGCTVGHLNYKRQIFEKTKNLKNAISGADDQLALLSVEPRSELTKSSSRVEVFAFSKRPLDPPVWGQLSQKKPIPGERKNKFFLPTPQCKLLPSSALNLLGQMTSLITSAAAADGACANLFTVYDEVLKRGFFRSAVIQTVKSKTNQTELLLTVVTATAPTPAFLAALTAQVAEPLMQSVPQLKGVVVIEARTDLGRDREFFSKPEKTHVLTGEPFLSAWIESVGIEVRVDASTQSWDVEVLERLLPDIQAAVVGGMRGGRVVEISGGKSVITPVLETISGESFLTLSEGRFAAPQSLLGEDGGIVERIGDSGGSSVDERVGVVTEDRVDVAVVSFPWNEDSKPEIKGATSKKFRHWLGNVVKPERVVIVTDRADGLRKDIGHMKLMGYELVSMRAIDAQPGVMDKIATVVVMQRRPKYDQIHPEQIIE